MENTEAKITGVEDIIDAKKEPTLPAKIKMTRQWSYFDKKGQHHAWAEGFVVEDPDDIKQIIVDCKNKNYVVMD